MVLECQPSYRGPDRLRAAKATVVSIAVCLLGLSGVFTAWAQIDRGTLAGTVTDRTGAVLVGVSLTAVDVATGVKSKITSGPSGAFAIPVLPPGTYRVTSEIKGFKTHVLDNVGVQVNQTTRLDIVMEVGEMSQTVEVDAEGPQLRAESSDLQTVVTQQEFRIYR